jgi:hypothetical protein
MTVKVYKSQLAGLGFEEFGALVEEYRQALLAHRFTGDAAPTNFVLVEQAVRRVPVEGAADEFVADYEPVDDTPVPIVPTLAEMRALLLATVRAAENDAALAVITNGKLRLLSLDAKDAMMKPVAERTVADLATLEAMVSVQNRRAAIERHAAVIEAAIDDLPADQVATYQFEAFPS